VEKDVSTASSAGRTPPAPAFFDEDEPVETVLSRWALGFLGVVLASCASDAAQSSADEIVGRDRARQGPVANGFADLHVHMMGEDAFGGAWFHGSYDREPMDCDGGFPPSDHARIRQNISDLLAACPSVSFAESPLLDAVFSVGGSAASEFLAKTEGTQGDTGLHLRRTHAGRDFPRWDTIAHHAVWETWLRTAHERGLSLMVMSAVTFQFLCEMMPDANRKRECDERADIDVQLDRVHDFVRRNTWAEIALSPREARRIIAEGKLALVLSIEASSVFEDVGDWRPLFDAFYAKGVRTLQIAHQLDNRFAGAALHNPIFHVAQFRKTCHIDTDCGATIGGKTLGFDVDRECKNMRGLTREGADFAREMMKRGMPIDIAHLSERGVAALYEVAKDAQYYPLYVSHGHFREIMNPELAKTEKTTPAEIIRIVRKTGGMFGLRTADDETKDYVHASVPNDCHGSSKSFAQAFEFGAKELKVGLALGSDFNGFIQQTRPRFGDFGACSAGFAEEADAQRARERDSGPRPLGTEFDEKGLAHIGLLPDLIDDLRGMGVDMSPIARSAERFLVMWERAQGVRTGPADDANDLSTGGVAPYVPKDVRRAQY
jgi:microsomal dipeptidase-like Zn-dependent dipeptidase